MYAAGGGRAHSRNCTKPAAAPVQPAAFSPSARDRRIAAPPQVVGLNLELIAARAEAMAAEEAVLWDLSGRLMGVLHDVQAVSALLKPQLLMAICTAWHRSLRLTERHAPWPGTSSSCFLLLGAFSRRPRRSSNHPLRPPAPASALMP